MIGVKYANWFGDKRIEARGTQLHGTLFRNATQSIQSMSSSRAEQKGFYRFLHNSKTTEKKLIAELTDRCQKMVKDKVVLSIQDTSEINLSAHRGRLKKNSGVGGIDDHFAGIGFKIHPCFVVDAMSCFPIGFSNIRIWNREEGMGDKYKREYNKLPIEAKESYKWIEGSTGSKEVLSQARAVIIVQDREGDIFEQFVQIPDEKTFLLVRSCVSRKVGSDKKLWDTLSKATVLGQYELTLSADKRRKEPSRTAVMEVRCVEVQLQCPKNDKRNRLKTVTAYAIEAKEINSMAQQPVHWRLVTTWPVSSYADALQIIEWYSWRWLIEEVFRMLKKEGFNIEGSEIESGWAIRKLTVMMLDVIVKLMQMHIAYNCPEGESPETAMMFTEKEQECLAGVNRKMEGSTKALKNPYSPSELKWAVWIIARIGGWKGYASQRPPGMTTLFKGLEKFYLTYDGWTLQKDVGTR
jgi:Transposase DNA-binding/Transposase DDE domain